MRAHCDLLQLKHVYINYVNFVDINVFLSYNELLYHNL